MRATTSARDERKDDRVDDSALADGRYDAFVVWAEARDDGRVAFELTLTTGANKGDLITVLARSGADPIGQVGLPCTLIVENDQPRIDFS